MPLEPQLSSLAITAAGSFSPQIFQPKWMIQQGLLPKEIEGNLEVEVVSGAVTAFKSDWFRFVATQNQLIFSTHLESQLPPLKDLAVGTILSITRQSVSALAINYDCHFAMPNENEWHAVGHRLAPKEPWSGILEKPGMLTVQMKGLRTDGLTGEINVTVQPSVRITPHGVYFMVNDHVGKSPEADSFDAIAALTAIWPHSLDRSKKIAQSLLTKK